MQIQRLRLASFRHLDGVDIRFDAGVVLVTGEHGAGKSTLLEAILWALYGSQVVRGGEGSLRLHDNAAEATSVTLDFVRNDDHFRVTRTLGHEGPAVTLHRDGGRIADGDAADAEIAALLGRREQFMHAAVTGRREIQHLVQLRPSDRLRALARLLGAPAPAAPPVLETLQREIAESDARLRTLQSAPDLIAQYTTELERARADLAEAERDAERLHDEWAQKRQDVETRLAAYGRRAEEISRQIDSLAAADGSGVCPTCEQPLSSMELLMSRLDDEVYTAAQDTKWLAQRQTQLAHKPPDVSAAETRRARLRELVADRTERVARCEQAMQELWTVATDRRRALAYVDALRAAAETTATTAVQPPDAETLHRLGSAAGAMLERVSRYDSVVIEEDGRVFARERGVVMPVVSGADEDLVALVLRVAVMRLLRSADDERPILIDEPFSMMAAGARDALLTVFGELAPQVVVCTAAPVQDRTGTQVVRLPAHGGSLLSP